MTEANNDTNHFSLDSVRDSFELDVRSRLETIGKLLRKRMRKGEASRKKIDDASQAAHAIRGLAAMVNQTSLSEPARCMEMLLEILNSYVQAGAPQGNKLREFCGQTCDTLNEITTAILDDRPAVAAELSDHWMSACRERFGEQLSAYEQSDMAVGAGETGDTAGGGAVAESGESAEGGAAANSDDDEAIEAFRAELDSYRGELEASLTAAENGDDDARSRISNLVLTIKGTAQTIGLTAQAEPLDKLYESLIGNATVELTWVVDMFNGLLTELGLNPVRPFGSAQSSVVLAGFEPEAASEETAVDGFEDDELRQIFVEEMSEYRPQMVSALAGVINAPNDSNIYEPLRRVFHRIKGSAATVGLAALSDLAAKDQFVCESIVEGDATPSEQQANQLRDSLNELLGMVDIDAIEPGKEVAATEPEEATVIASNEDDELVDVFREELREYADEMCLALLGMTSNATETANYERVRRVFHRIKGSAAVVGLDSLSAQAKEHEDACRQVVEAHVTADDNAAKDMVHRLELLLSNVGLDTLISASQADEPVVDSTIPETSEMTIVGPLDIEEDLLEAFMMDVSDTGEKLEEDMLLFEQASSDRELARTIARHLHTLKGAANSVGLTELGGLLHTSEDLLDYIASGVGGDAASQDVIQVLMDVTDRVRAQSGELREDPEVAEQRNHAVLLEVQTLVAHVQSLVDGTGVEVEPTVPAIIEATEVVEEVQAKREVDPFDAQYVRVEARALDTLLNLVGELVVSRTMLDEKIGAINVLRSELQSSQRRLRTTLEEFQNRFEYSLNMADSASTVSSNLGGSSFGVRSDVDEGLESYSEGFTELEFDKYDDFNILSRTMVEMVSDVNEVGDQINGVLNALDEDTGRFHRVTGQLQSQLMTVRMMPVGTVFRRLLRPVRDAAQRERKIVNTRIEGESVTIDKNVAERIFRPLLHIVRNAVSHGIESPDQRKSNGKPEAGTVTLRAEHQANSVLIEVTDDGAGLDFESIERQAREFGLVAGGATVGREELTNLIFSPGFTTRSTTTDVAGRGVGLDVVRQAVDDVKGAVNVSSTPNGGTTFHIRLPLTLTISQAMLVRVGDQQFAVPIEHIESCQTLSSEDVLLSRGERVIRHQDKLIGLVDLHELLDVPQKDEDTAIDHFVAVILRIGNRLYAMQVDQVFARREIVVKSLGDLFGRHEIFSGATLTGDGRVMLILDITGLLGHRESFSVSIDSINDSDVTVASPDGQGPAVREPERRRASDKVQVLVVDDSISVRRVASQHLKTLGYDVETAVDGLAALEELRRREFDIVFTDLEMPRLHGYQLIAEMKQQETMKDIPIVVVTSRSGGKHQRKAEELGAVGYITKPFTREMLNDNIIDHVKSKWS